MTRSASTKYSPTRRNPIQAILAGQRRDAHKRRVAAAMSRFLSCPAIPGYDNRSFAQTLLTVMPRGPYVRFPAAASRRTAHPARRIGSYAKAPRGLLLHNACGCSRSSSVFPAVQRFLSSEFGPGTVSFRQGAVTTSGASRISRSLISSNTSLSSIYFVSLSHTFGFSDRKRR